MWMKCSVLGVRNTAKGEFKVCGTLRFRIKMLNVQMAVSTDTDNILMCLVSGYFQQNAIRWFATTG